MSKSSKTQHQQAVPQAAEVLVYDRGQLALSLELVEAVEFGRQGEREEGPYSQSRPCGCTRVVVARADERTISRRQLRLEPLGGGRVLLKNLSETQPVVLADGAQVEPKASREVGMPVVINLGDKSIYVQSSTTAAAEPMCCRLEQATVMPGSSLSGQALFPALRDSVRLDDTETLLRWLQHSMSVFQSAAGSRDFFSKAAKAVIDIVGLDCGRVLLCRDDQWHVEALQTAGGIDPATVLPPSRRVLSTVQEERRTLWELPAQAPAGSILGIGAVVAAPILDRQGNVLGIVYGDRRLRGEARRLSTISKLEAMLVELIACGVAAGLARLEQEQAALTARVRFDQFFTPELSRQLAAEPDLLDGRDCEVSVLFCDIRDFTTFSERLGPARTVEWIQDVMGTLSACVLKHRGVLVDYIGDELMAMWGAPQEQPDHARLACRAALDMLAKLPAVNQRWQDALQGPMNLGIGVNSGVARVGNTGSQYKFKYGPLGNTVNLASRVEGATKHLRTRLLITGATRSGLDESFAVRRLCRVRVVNILQPVDLYELAPADDACWSQLKLRYEQALDDFEQAQYRHAAQIAGNLLHEYPNDGPALMLLSRSVQALLEESAQLDPVWDLPGK